jgi:hypothetical protein
VHKATLGASMVSLAPQKNVPNWESANKINLSLNKPIKNKGFMLMLLPEYFGCGKFEYA